MSQKPSSPPLRPPNAVPSTSTPAALVLRQVQPSLAAAPPEVLPIRNRLQERASKGYVFDDCIREYNPDQLQLKCEGQAKGKKYQVHGVNLLNRDNLDTTTASRRLQRRREQHNRIERKRRDLINQYIAELTELVMPPAASSATTTAKRLRPGVAPHGDEDEDGDDGEDGLGGSGSGSKPGRSDVLRRTVHYVRSLAVENETLKSQQLELSSEIELLRKRLEKFELAPGASSPPPLHPRPPQKRALLADSHLPRSPFPAPIPPPNLRAIPAASSSARPASPFPPDVYCTHLGLDGPPLSSPFPPFSSPASGRADPVYYQSSPFLPPPFHSSTSSSPPFHGPSCPFDPELPPALSSATAPPLANPYRHPWERDPLYPPGPPLHLARPTEGAEVPTGPKSRAPGISGLAYAPPPSRDNNDSLTLIEDNPNPMDQLTRSSVYHLQ
ncbi:hypothetical protein H4R33_000108 [Dimargaris cristalligena]|uniref:BHLH domain-containing protein n=1 Tax=Dimargaris cristalligena TaxID=215637 RepID=A0A4P9ZSC4_9FUNG|nr:hypothetical protein H4R33_000108 [Dimargaris cristalligena]RKP36466.1 hypothetical protein BJ085DRAFT_36248 [Dimargaris cristalligena]|eukprot:RKP36466.1 hypothetical protein BJ085DRAFT_36248 [Dimargaris cristalligena]